MLTHHSSTARKPQVQSSECGRPVLPDGDLHMHTEVVIQALNPKPYMCMAGGGHQAGERVPARVWRRDQD